MREASRRLAQDGLLEHRPRRGYRVPELTSGELDDLYEVRIHLELLSVRRAAAGPGNAAVAELVLVWGAGADTLRPGTTMLHLDEQFHVGLALATGQRALADTIDSINARIRLVRVRDFLNEDRVRATVIQHRAILDAIVAGDAALAGRLMRRHILESRAFVAGVRPTR